MDGRPTEKIFRTNYRDKNKEVNKTLIMEDDEILKKYGDTPLHFSHYYNFLFIFKSTILENGEQISLQLGGNMEKVSALVIDAKEPMTLNENGEGEIALIKDQDKKVIWQQELDF